VGVDVVVVTLEGVERYRDTHCLVICPALREGKVVYGAEKATNEQSPHAPCLLRRIFR
jgi:hypothetical protein